MTRIARATAALLLGVAVAAPAAHAQQLGPGMSSNASNATLPDARTNLVLGTASAVAFKQLSFGNQSINHAGSLSAATTLMYGTPFFFGSSNASQDALAYFGISDAVNYYGVNSLVGIGVFLSPGAGAGNRIAFHGQTGVQTAASPGDPSFRNSVGVKGTGFATVNNGGKSGRINNTSYNGGVFGGASTARLSGAATSWQTTYGHEIDVSIDAGSSSALKSGLAIVHTVGDRTRGTYKDTAIDVGDQTDASMSTWLNGASFGSEVDQYPLGSDSTVLRVMPRAYATLGTAPFKYGVDLRRGTITAGGLAFASPNFQVDPVGVTYGNGLTTSGTVAAKSATLTGVTVADGGVYLAVPTFTVQAPPSGGSTATATVATMAGASDFPILGFGASGSGVTLNDVLSCACGTGTQPTFTAAAVDGSGGVTTLNVTTPGSLSVVNAGPILLTGGTGTGVWVNIVYADAAGVYTASSTTFAATGSGFANGNILTVVGDTGTATQLTVASVTATGGILTATRSTAGSLTAIAAGTYHTVTGGAGSGASLQIGYAVATVNVTAGSGYLPLPLPIITSSLTDYRIASLTATMTAADAPLNLTGSTVKLNGALVEATLVSTQTATASTSLAWEGLAGAEYKVRCSNLRPSSVATILYLQLGEGGTPTWETANYSWAARGWESDGTNVQTNSTSAAGINLNVSSDVTVSGYGLSGYINLHSLSSAALNKQVDGNVNFAIGGGATSVTLNIAGAYNGDQGAITAVRIFPSTGTITSGNCSLYQVNS